ncbi:MAG: glycosyltransferase family 39 protein [Alphaproteobacteria bacterium]|nr:glycosyltransferase family 39 protein [Alphaproteobacteria bacterium]
MLRLALAAALPLAPDEAYYWVWSRALAPGYVDHPPMIALWIRAGTWAVGDTALGIRLLGPLAAALGSFLLWDAAERLLPGRSAGVIAASLLNATLAVGVGAIIVTPDSPLLLFWTLCLWAMARIIAGGSGAWWLAVGLFAGLAIASKYTAALPVLSIGLWLVLAGRVWLRRGEPYAAAALALLTLIPVLWWNASHDWISFVRQGSRAADWSPQRAPQYLLELFAGQTAIATPLVFLFFVAGTVRAARSAWRYRDPACSLLALLGIVPTLVFFQHAIGDRVQPNWPAVCYPAAAVATAGLSGRFWQRLRLPAIALGLMMTGAVYAQAIFAPLPLPAKRDPIALQLDGWPGLAAAVEKAHHGTSAGFVAADNYGVAAELARELPPAVLVVAIGPRWASFDLPAPKVDGMKAILVVPEDHATPIWPAAEQIGTADRKKNGVVIQSYKLYLAISDHATSAVLLPRPAIDPGR